MDAETRLQDLGLALPTPPRPVASYLPVRRVGSLLFVSGQLPVRDGVMLATGKVPSETSVERAHEASRQCVLNALAAAVAEVGSLRRVTGVVRVGVFVQSDDRFYDQPTVANGASDLLVQLFGDAGRHARAAVGTNALPLNAAVEVEFVFLCQPTDTI